MRLLELRKKKKASQKEIADALYLSQTGYSSYENERTEPNIEMLCKIADYYNVSLDYLVGREYNNDIGYLNEIQKNAVQIIQHLNDLNLAKAIAYMSGLLVNQ